MYKYELYHHGIPGQKHGVRHGPPYPLSRKQSNSIVKRAKKKLATIQKARAEKKKAKAEEKARAKEEQKKIEQTRASRKLDLTTVSDEELKKLNNRMTLEINYNDNFNKLYKNKISNGEKFKKWAMEQAVNKGKKLGEFYIGELANMFVQEYTGNKDARLFNKEYYKKKEENQNNNNNNNDNNNNNKTAQVTNNYNYYFQNQQNQQNQQNGSGGKKRKRKK